MATRCGGFNPSKNAAAVMPNKNKELCSDRFTQGVCKGMCIETMKKIWMVWQPKIQNDYLLVT